MQPYIFPYIGYFQLIAAVDAFVVYDNIKYTKKGWINRNRYLLNGQPATFSLPLRKDSDELDIRDRQLSADFNRSKLLAQVREAYRKAPHFIETLALMEQVIGNPVENLFDYLHSGITRTCEHLKITTPILVSSTIDADHSLHSQERVIGIAKAVGASEYINPIGGLALYSKDEFARQSLTLGFIRSRPFDYPQFGEVHVPWLSIMDVLMFNGAEKSRESLLPQFDLI